MARRHLKAMARRQIERHGLGSEWHEIVVRLAQEAFMSGDMLGTELRHSIKVKKISGGSKESCA